MSKNRENLLKEIESYKQENKLTKMMYGYLEKRIHERDEYAKKLDKDTYYVAFIGSVGVGKTTVESTITDLIIGDSFKKTVLPTASGRISLGTVHILQNHDDDNYKISIDPMPVEEVSLYVEYICKREFLGESENIVPVEIERVLRNMASLPRGHSKEEEGLRRYLIENGKEIDDITAKKVFLAQLNYQERINNCIDNEIIINFDANKDDAKDLLKNELAAINNGKKEGYPVAQKIYLKIPYKPIKTSKYNVIICDTRGIDGKHQKNNILLDRTDLAEFFVEMDTPTAQKVDEAESVVVLCTRFLDAPDQYIIDLLSDAKKGASKICTKKSAILAIAKNQEAQEVIDDYGEPVDDIEQGYKLKTREINDRLMPHVDEKNGNFNIVCFDVSVEARNVEKIYRLVDSLIDGVRSIEETKIDNIDRNIRDILDYVNNKGEKFELKEAFKDEISGIIRVTKNNNFFEKEFSSLKENLLKFIREKHHSTVKAAIKRNGVWRNLQVYDILWLLLLEWANSKVMMLVDDLCLIVKSKSDDKIYGNIREIIEMDISLIQEDYAKTLISNIAKDMNREIGYALYKDTKFWRARSDEVSTTGAKEKFILALSEWIEEQIGTIQNNGKTKLNTLLSERWDEFMLNIAAIWGKNTEGGAQ